MSIRFKLKNQRVPFDMSWFEMIGCIRENGDKIGIITYTIPEKYWKLKAFW
jgi:hypothetical protein